MGSLLTRLVEASTDNEELHMAIKVQTLLTGLAFGESPRWHEHRLWLSNWGVQEVIAVVTPDNSTLILAEPPLEDPWFER